MGIQETIRVVMGRGLRPSLVGDNVSKYLGFPINYKMPQKEKNKQILWSIQGNLTIWRSKKLSFTSKNFGCKPRVYAKPSGSFQVDVELIKILKMLYKLSIWILF
jgi:hypothetical protein